MLKSRYLRLLCEFIGIGFLIFIVFIPRTKQQIGKQSPQFVESLYLSLSKIIFTIGLILMILPYILGVKNFVRQNLDMKTYNFIRKISFSTYLVHLIIIFYFLGSINHDFYFSVIKIIPKFIGYALISMVFDFVLYICVEVPFGKIQKYCLGNFVYYLIESKKKQKHHKDQLTQQTENQHLLKEILQEPTNEHNTNIPDKHMTEQIQENEQNSKQQMDVRRFSIN